MEREEDARALLNFKHLTIRGQVIKICMEKVCLTLSSPLRDVNYTEAWV